MTRSVRALLPVLVRAGAHGGPHAEAARRVLVWVLLAQLLADGGHAGPPHRPLRAPRCVRAQRSRRHAREALAGRRPRG